MDSRIPIFPLNLVMFPGSVYPLHIFEERYKKLIAKCLSDESGFGIVSKIDSETSEIGCYVYVDRILKKYENGSMDIYVKGTERFKTQKISFTGDGYLEADILPYNDNDLGSFDYDKMNLLLKMFQSLLTLTEIELGKSYWKKLNAAENKSFKIAEKSGMTIKDQQKILTFRSENERIDFLIKHFEKVEIYIQKTAEMTEIIIGDGYIN